MNRNFSRNVFILPIMFFSLRAEAECHNEIEYFNKMVKTDENSEVYNFCVKKLRANKSCKDDCKQKNPKYQDDKVVKDRLYDPCISSCGIDPLPECLISVDSFVVSRFSKSFTISQTTDQFKGLYDFVACVDPNPKTPGGFSEEGKKALNKFLGISREANDREKPLQSNYALQRANIVKQIGLIEKELSQTPDLCNPVESAIAKLVFIDSKVKETNGESVPQVSQKELYKLFHGSTNTYHQFQKCVNPIKNRNVQRSEVGSGKR